MTECRSASSVDDSSVGRVISDGDGGGGGGGCLITTTAREFRGTSQIFGVLIVLGIFIIGIAGSKNS